MRNELVNDFNPNLSTSSMTATVDRFNWVAKADSVNEGIDLIKRPEVCAVVIVGNAERVGRIKQVEGSISDCIASEHLLEQKSILSDVRAALKQFKGWKDAVIKKLNEAPDGLTEWFAEKEEMIVAVANAFSPSSHYYRLDIFNHPVRTYCESDPEVKAMEIHTDPGYVIISGGEYLPFLFEQSDLIRLNIRAEDKQLVHCTAPLSSSYRPDAWSRVILKGRTVESSNGDVWVKDAGAAHCIPYVSSSIQSETKKPRLFWSFDAVPRNTET